MMTEDQFSNDLKALLEFELSRGNSVSEVHPSHDGTGPPLFIALLKPFRYLGAVDRPQLPSTLQWKEIDDAHFQGWAIVCSSIASGHVLAAPRREE